MGRVWGKLGFLWVGARLQSSKAYTLVESVLNGVGVGPLSAKHTQPPPGFPWWGNTVFMNPLKAGEINVIRN